MTKDTASRYRWTPNNPGPIINGYEPIGLFGMGAFGVVEKVRRIADGAIFARKAVLYNVADEMTKVLIVNEVNVLRKLEHVGITRYIDRYIDREGCCLYVVLEYCAGGDLHTFLNAKRTTGDAVDEDDIWRFLGQMSAALNALHNCSTVDADGYAIGKTTIIHRDMKPANVLLDTYGNFKLADFGLAKETDDPGNHTQSILGTGGYMCPELVDHAPYDTKADMYGMGLIAYEMATLINCDSIADIGEGEMQVSHHRFEPIPECFSPQLRQLIQVLLNKNPQRRPTARQLLSTTAIQATLARIPQRQLSLERQEQQAKIAERQKQLDKREIAMEAREKALRAAEERFAAKEDELAARMAKLATAERAASAATAAAAATTAATAKAATVFSGSSTSATTTVMVKKADTGDDKPIEDPLERLRRLCQRGTTPRQSHGRSPGSPTEETGPAGVRTPVRKSPRKFGPAARVLAFENVDALDTSMRDASVWDGGKENVSLHAAAAAAKMLTPSPRRGALLLRQSGEGLAPSVANVAKTASKEPASPNAAEVEDSMPSPFIRRVAAPPSLRRKAIRKPVPVA